MKTSVYQLLRKDAEGMMAVYVTINNGNKRTLITTGIKTQYPIVKTGGVGIGIQLNKKEPQGRLKLKRIEALFNEVEEYCTEHPNMRSEAIKKAFMRVKRTKGELVSAMNEYANSDKLSKSAADIIRRTARKVEAFDAKAGFTIDETWLDNFSTYLKSKGARPNGIGLHLRNIRTVFNYARKKRLTKEYPFLDYTIKVERQVIRNMSSEQIKAFKDYPCEPWQVEYRDIFMLSFYLGGINIGDLLTCKGLENGRVIYQRKKTSRPISIPVHPAAQAIIDKYKGKDFLINPCDRYKDYHGYMHRMNDGLKKIGVCKIVPDKVGKLRKKQIEPFYEGLSTYVARYTFASVAAECGVQRDIIAACLGHSWADVTSHYIAYQQQLIDDAVKKVCDYVVADSSPVP